MMKYPTPHINAKPGDFGKTVLMPGDPLRSQFIAETFLENPVLVNNVRGVQGHTGTYRGVQVSVMASGMGMPSIGIYSHELYNVFGVPIGSFDLLTKAVEAARELGCRYHVGNVLSSDAFYGDHEGVPNGLDANYGWKKMGILAVEMEAAALYMNAARYGKGALCICTVSDHILTGEETTAQERQNALTDMMKAV